jgi:hypothetical protein
MALVIEDEEVCRDAGRLAALTGQTVAAAVHAAVRDKLLANETLRPVARPPVDAQDLLAAARACRATMRPGGQSAAHADLYGEDGLPAQEAAATAREGRDVAGERVHEGGEVLQLLARELTASSGNPIAGHRSAMQGLSWHDAAWRRRAAGVGGAGRPAPVPPGACGQRSASSASTSSRISSLSSAVPGARPIEKG